MELVIITGMSGAGKSNAADFLEDIGFYCIDNIPPMLIYDFAKLLKRTSGDIKRVAIVTDTRAGNGFNELENVLSKLQGDGIPYKILFLDASDDCLLHRYKETRRSHPLADGISVAEAIKKERMIMSGVRSRADYLLDTSYTKTSVLKQRISSLFLNDLNSTMTIQCMSFGFKYGIPLEADLIFDARCLPNPFYVPELKELTGIDKQIVDYVMNSENSKMFVGKMLDFIKTAVPMYRDEGKTGLVIAVGCTGGKHRSVALARMIYDTLSENKFCVSITHRDIGKDR